MPFPPAFIDEVIARNPIEDVVGQYVTLKRSGSNLFGLCPFHGEKTASFSVAPDKGMFYCFGCHKGGGVINFEMEIEGLSYGDAVRALAKRAGLEVPEDEQYQSRYRQQERLWALHKEAARFFHSCLYAPMGASALEYARGRGMSQTTLTKFGIGYAPDSWSDLVDAMRKKGYTDQELRDSGLVTVSKKNGNLFDRFRDRLMFPIIDVRGNVIGFGGRIMNDRDKNAAKYLNSPETLIFNKRKNLFALNYAKKSKMGYLILVEGYMDAIALHQYGFDCAVASLGTALTDDGATLLSRYTDQVVLIYDGDTAGQNATQRAIPMLEKAGLQVKVLKMRDAKDPDEFLKKYGADRFKILLEESSNPGGIPACRHCPEVRFAGRRPKGALFAGIRRPDRLSAQRRPAGRLRRAGGGGRENQRRRHAAGNPAGVEAASLSGEEKAGKNRPVSRPEFTAQESGHPLYQYEIRHGGGNAPVADPAGKRSAGRHRRPGSGDVLLGAAGTGLRPVKAAT